MNEMGLKLQCPILFSGSKGKAARAQARRELKFLREKLPENNPLRFQGEFAFYRMNHVTSVREFKKQFEKRGYPQYAWNIKS